MKNPRVQYFIRSQTVYGGCPCVYKILDADF